jgi:hypothetical protein
VPLAPGEVSLPSGCHDEGCLSFASLLPVLLPYLVLVSITSASVDAIQITYPKEQEKKYRKSNTIL